MRIIDYWPTILQDLLEFQRIAEAQQPEFDEANNVVNDLHNDFSLFTLSERGATRWEEILELQVRPGDDIETRRSRILTKFLSQLPYTYRALLRYLEQVSGGDYTVNMDVANYELFVSARLSGYDMRTALMAALASMIPANMTLKMQSKIQQTIQDAKIITVARVVTINRKLWRPNTTTGGSNVLGVGVLGEIVLG